MHSKWKASKWGDLATLEYGRALRGHEAEHGAFRVFGTNGPTGWCDRTLTPEQTVIVGRKGAYRGIHLSLEPCWVIDTAFYLVPKSDIDIQWAYYQLLTQDINSMDSGSAIPSTSRGDFYQLPVLVPPLAEQRAIASVLGTLDDKIELNRQMNRTLEELAAVVFRSWFVDFDPVRAKAAGRAPVGMDAETAALFPDRLVESEIGEIPEGWTAGTLADIATNPREVVDPSNIAPNTPYFGLEHLPRRSIALTEWGTAGDASSAKSVFSTEDILFGRLRPYFHKVGVAPVDGVCSTDILVIRPKRQDLIGLVLGYASSADVIRYSETGSEGTRMPRVSWKYLGQYPIPIPPTGLSARFTSLTEPMIERIRANIFESTTLAQLRDALLPRLLSGELRVPAEVGVS